ncbi:centromere protein I-like [Leguminivora glycinivorella]|uniref:centromere protein I-like n=1 Tax=Leguminivora glycinivorella TaxID=1035111 RepID=UPI00200BFB3F|nr:centromere protein I-like [Leguminivora glycinivorella]
MSDVHEIIDYIKSLKKGFDKDLFQSKIDELAHAVDTVGLEYEDFHKLFIFWLNLTIPITKWTSIGVCLVPQNSVTEQTVDYALRWLLANAQNQTNFTRIAFLLDWLTVAMDCESVDITALDCGYEVFFSFLTYEVLAAHVLKLVYTLTKPTDVTRMRVLELFDYAKKRESKKSMCRQLQVLLGLFKSYKPECVPEDIPAVPIHTTFKSNITLLTRFKKWQEQRNEEGSLNQHLMWTNPMLGGKAKKGESLVPNIEFLNIGSQQYQDKEPQKNYLDFTDPVSLLQYSVHRSVSRPARLRALLRNNTGRILLALSDARTQATLDHDLHYMLTGCFLDASPHSELEKRDALHCVAVLQRTLCQPIRAATAFLAHLLPLWDETHYFNEILELMEWVEPDPELLQSVLEPIARMFHRAQPVQQCAILRTLAIMYTNLVYASTRRRQYFVSPVMPSDIYKDALSYVASTISTMSGRALQVDPDDHRALYSCISSALRIARAQLSLDPPTLPALPPLPALTLPLLTVSADLLDKMAALILTYKEIMFAMQSNKENRKDQSYTEQKRALKGYTSDIVRCLVDEGTFSGRQTGLVFQRLHPTVVQKLTEYIPESDSALSIRNHLAFAPYMYIQTDALDSSFADNELWFDAVINKEFTHLSTLLNMLGWGRKMVT